MKIIYVGLLTVILSVNGYAQSTYFEKNPEGWHWNNMKEAIKQTKSKKTKSTDPIIQMKTIQKTLEIAKDRAVLHPTVSNIRDYLVIQNRITEQSTLFAQNWQKTLLLYPEFDYNLKHPVDSSENQAYQTQLHDLKVQTAHQLSSQFGLLYFYRGNDALDQVMAKTVLQFSSWYHFSLIGVSVDGKAIATINNNRINHGQLQAFNIKALPALVLVNPITGARSILSYGYASNDDLLTSCFNLATNFREL